MVKFLLFSAANSAPTDHRLHTQRKPVATPRFQRWSATGPQQQRQDLAGGLSPSPGDQHAAPLAATASASPKDTPGGAGESRALCDDSWTL